MYVAGYIVAGFIVAGVYASAWLKGRRDRYHRTGLVVALSFAALAAPVQVIVGDWAGPPGGRVPAGQARRDGGPATRRRRARRSRSAASTTTSTNEVAVRDRDPAAALRARRPQPERDDPGAGDRAAGGPPAGQLSCASRSRPWSGSAPALALLGTVFALTWWRKRRLPRSPWFYRAVMLAGPLSLVALICGWITTEVGRQPWIVYETMRVSDAVTASDGLEVGFVVLVRGLPRRRGRAVVWLHPAASPREPPQTEVRRRR